MNLEAKFFDICDTFANRNAVYVWKMSQTRTWYKELVSSLIWKRDEDIESRSFLSDEDIYSPRSKTPFTNKFIPLKYAKEYRDDLKVYCLDQISNWEIDFVPDDLIYLYQSWLIYENEIRLSIINYLDKELDRVLSYLWVLSNSKGVIDLQLLNLDEYNLKVISWWLVRNKLTKKFLSSYKWLENISDIYWKAIEKELLDTVLDQINIQN